MKILILISWLSLYTSGGRFAWVIPVWRMPAGVMHTATNAYGAQSIPKQPMNSAEQTPVPSKQKWIFMVCGLCRGSSPNPSQKQRLTSVPPHTAPDLHASRPNGEEEQTCEGERWPWMAYMVIFIQHLHYSPAVYRYAYTPLIAGLCFPFAFINNLIPTLCNPTLSDTLWIWSSGCNQLVHKLWSEEIYHPLCSRAAGRLKGLPANKSIGL